MKNIILLAAPAAGKGTLAKALKEKYNLAHISTGDLLRDATKKQDALAKKISDMMAQGMLVTDEIIYELLERRLQEEDCKNGYILDGFPRNIEQAKKYDEILEKLNMDLGCVIELEIPKEMLKMRATGRRVCTDCGAIYHISSNGMQPKVEGICDKCGGKIYQRSDDNEEAFENRYNTYLEKTAPLIDFYTNKGVLYKVDSSKDPEYTLQQVLKIIEK